MPVKFLKKQRANTEALVIQHLHAAMHRQDKPRTQKQLHASHLTSTEFCARKEYLIVRDNVALKSRTIDTPLTYTFDEGNDKQARFNNDWLRHQHYGNWVCNRCDAEHHGFAPDIDLENDTSDPCPSPKGHEWRYREVVFRDPKTNIIGSVDSLLKLAPEKPLLPVEVKIMKGEDFRLLAAPLAEHTLRTKLYLYLIAKSKTTVKKLIDTTAAQVLYMARGHGYKLPGFGVSPFKAFTVTRDDKSIMTYVNHGYALELARKKKLLPARVCDSISCPLAKKCPVSKVCFSAPEGEITWANRHGTPVHPTIPLVADAQAKTQ